MRQDFVIVDGKITNSDQPWNCGTVPRESGDYFYVCDMPIDVRRVVFGKHSRDTITARYFFLVTGIEDPDVVGPDVKADRRAAAILWQGDDGSGSYVLMKFPGRWCVPAWMPEQYRLSDAEVAQLRRAGYPLCSSNE
jgi:hypothetical protein